MSDLISRQAAIDMFQNLSYDDWNQGVSTSWADAYSECAEMIRELPSAEPEYRLDEWCTDCKEYDHERHCCPRFNHVIRTTLQEIQTERKGK